MSVPNFDAQDPFESNPEGNSKEAIPASEDDKRDILTRAGGIAKRGRHYDYPTSGVSAWMITDTVPGTRDTLAVVMYDKPSQTLGHEGFVMQITYGQAIGAPMITGSDEELYDRVLTKYAFFEIPDGIHVDKSVNNQDLGSTFDAQAAPQAEEEINWEALDEAIRESEEDRAMQRELGMNFFSAQDAEDVQGLLNLTWPPQA